MQFPALQNILWTAAAYNKIRPGAIVFPSSEPREASEKRKIMHINDTKEEILER